MGTVNRAFITGAASGIGFALAKTLLERGSSVFMADVNGEALEAAAQTLSVGNRVPLIRALNVANREDVEAAVAEAESAMGGIDAIFNNAGVSLSDTVDKMTYDDLERLMNINFYGVVYGTKAALPAMLARGSGHIVNISSLFGLIGVPGQSAYCAAKHAVKGFNESLFYELDGTGVQVHSVHPGGVDTNIVRSGKHLNDRNGQLDPSQVQKNFQAMAITSPDEAARIILRGVMKGQHRVLVGRDAQGADRLQRWMPNAWRKYFLKKLTSMGQKSPY